METVQEDVFLRGILLALRERGETFVASGHRFHDSFGEALDAAEQDYRLNPVATAMAESFDPVFGVFEDASRMILLGMRDRILGLDCPENRTARFRVSEETARVELDQLPAAETFRRMVVRWKTS